MKKYIFIIALIIVAAGAIVVLLSSLPNGTLRPSALDSFAQCLAAKNATMYGAYRCSHCQNEKAAFGSSFRYVPYVECTAETEKCLAAGVEGYPTWILGDGRRLVGEQGLQRLAQASGCALPAQ